MEIEEGVQEVVVIPIDEHDRVVLFSEIKIEKVDLHFRSVRDPQGIAYHLAPGEYRVKVLLPSLQMKIATLEVKQDIHFYKIRIEYDTRFQTRPGPEPVVPAEPVRHTEPVYQPEPAHSFMEKSQPVAVDNTAPESQDSEESRVETRFDSSFPVSYRTDGGKWISTKAVNVSTTGLCLANTHGKIAGENVYVRLFVPISSIPLECPARVCWSEDPETGLQLFLTTNMKSSLSNWLAHLNRR